MSKTVFTFEELKSAVEDADTTEILLGGDITFTGGIPIPSQKKVLSIDGGGHTVTDRNSSSYSDALYVPAGAGEKTVTVRNAVWSGRNYYGVVCVYDDTNNAGVTTVLENITYRGPQMIYNRYGATVVRDCVVSIEKNGASVSAQEFCEGNRLTLSGHVSITSAAASSALIWFPFAGSAFTVGASAVVSVTVPNSYLFYIDSAAKPKFIFGQNSSVEISVKSGWFYSSGSGAHIADSFSLETGASLTAVSAGGGSVPFFKCAGTFSVAEDASLSFAVPSGTAALLYFSKAADVRFENPRHVVLYSGGGKVFSFGSGTTQNPNTVSLSAGQIHLWTQAKTPYATAGGLNDIPSSTFRKESGTVTLRETLTSSAYIAAESNLAEGDTGYPVGVGNADLTKTAVLSAGTFPLTADPLTDLSLTVTGTTEASAEVIYTDSRQTVSGTADDTGAFSLTLSEQPTVGDTALIRAGRAFLSQSVSETINGSVSVTHLPDIPFSAFSVPRRTAKIRRLLPDWYMELTDTRPKGGGWTLYVALSSPLQTEGETVENAVTFTENRITDVLTEKARAVRSGTTTGAGTIRISWEETEGILLDIGADDIYKNGKYAAVLDWSVQFDL